MTIRQPLHPVLRGAIIERYGRNCQYCGGAGSLFTGPDGTPRHIDHKMPVSKGGTDDESNLTLACASCNIRKFNHMPWEDWRSPRTKVRRPPSARTKVRRARAAAAAVAHRGRIRSGQVGIGDLAAWIHVRLRDVRALIAARGMRFCETDTKFEYLDTQDALLVVAHFSAVDPEQIRGWASGATP